MRVITGFHAIEEKVLSLKKSGDPSSFQLYFSKPGPRVKKIVAAAKESGVTCSQVDDKKLDALTAELDETLRDHRGIVLTVSGKDAKPSNLVDFDSWLKTNGEKEKLSVVILDRVTDPHNVGAIIRSCDQFGADLVILPENNASNDIQNEIVSRSSAGAASWVPVSVVTNLVRTAEKLKDAGFWIYGADAGGENLTKLKFAPKSCLVMGSEGSGIARLLYEKCDTIVSIPTCGKIDSLNVSVAAGVLLYELYKSKLN